jgi:PPOX class probable F420-dependent enzyme
MREFNEQEREQFLAGKHVAVLSVGADGGRPPVSVPIWYDYQPGGNIVINTGATGRKARLVEKAGVVTVVVQNEDEPYQYVIVEGTVVDTQVPSPKDARAAIAVRYLGEEKGNAFAEQYDGSNSALLSIRPDRWSSRDFGIL